MDIIDVVEQTDLTPKVISNRVFLTWISLYWLIFLAYCFSSNYVIYAVVITIGFLPFAYLLLKFIQYLFSPSVLQKHSSIKLCSSDLIREKTIVMIPAYNEAETIKETINQVKNYVSKIVVIDDGSTDDTAKIAEDLNVIIVNNSQNMGLATTFYKGIKYCSQIEGVEAIINFDADLQYEAKEIPYLASSIINKQFDLCMGSRLEGNIEDMKTIKKIGNKIFTYLIGFLAGVKISDAQTGYRAFSPDLAKKLKMYSGFTYTQQMILQVGLHKLRIGELPINFRIRQHGESRLMKNAYEFAIRANKLLIYLYFNEFYPYKFVGFLLTLVSIFFNAFLLINY